MLIRHRNKNDVLPSEIVSKSTYLNRRQLIKAMGLGAAGLVTGSKAFAFDGELGVDRSVLQASSSVASPDWLSAKLEAVTPGLPSTSESVTPWEFVTGYNNFYEFGTSKTDPAENSRDFVTDPWSVEIAGEAELTGKFALEDIVKPHSLEERIYRLRCVEAWSMVVPWIGVSLADVLKRFKPTSKAKYVRFTTLYDPEQMPGQRSFFASLDYPYVEGLRMDEAMNELSFLAVGVFGEAMPNQNGAPIRLVVPWKYGFKSIKSIVKIEFTNRKPRTTWNLSAPGEYGFYANVNPRVSHPRWSQATERRLPGSLFSSNRIDTQLFNGYGEQVAHLYEGMSLRRNY